MKIRKYFNHLTILTIILGFSFSVFAGETAKVKAKWMKERKSLHAVAQKKLKANPDFKDMILKKYNENKVAINAKYKKLYAEAKKKDRKRKMAANKKSNSKKYAKKSRRPASTGSVIGAEEMQWTSAANSGMYSETQRRRYYNKRGYRLPVNVDVMVEEHDF